MGVKLQQENIEDKIKEWTLIDSAGFTLPHPNDNIGSISDSNQEVMMTDFLKTELKLTTFRNSCYFQFNKEIGNFTVNAGTRASYWTFNDEFLLSPRINVAYIPIWEKDVVFRAASGIYYQSPFYRELRDLEGTLNYEIEAQKSTHFVLGSDYLFYSWGRPFKLVSEIYTDLQNLIIQSRKCRIKYLAKTILTVCQGIDLKINGEFVPGVES